MIQNWSSYIYELATKTAAATGRLALESYYAFSLIPLKFYCLLDGHHVSLTLSILLYLYLDPINA